MPQASVSRVLHGSAMHKAVVSQVDSLEAVELSMALEAQNIVGSGFDNAVRHAAAAIGAEVLFNIPAPAGLPFQRAALVKIREDSAELVLVALDENGSTMHAHAENPETAHLFRLGEAWMAVVNQFKKLS